MTEISGLATALPLANARLERRDGDPTNDAFSGILQRGQNKHSEPRDGTDRPEDKDDTAMEERQPAPAAQADGAARRQRPPVPLEGQFVLLRHPGLSLRTAGEGEGENSAVTRDGQEEENQPSGDETEAAAATAARAPVTAAVLPLAPAEAPRRAVGGGPAATARVADTGNDRKPDAAQLRAVAAQTAPMEEETTPNDQPRITAQEPGTTHRTPPPVAGEPVDPLPIRVKVLADASHIGLGPAQSGETVSALAKSIAADRTMSEFARAAALPSDTPGVNRQAPVRDLTIQLQPISLGTVNARLRTQGEQLTVEIRVDNAEAFQRLSAERDALTTSLRGLGFKVDEVSIVQQPAAAQPAQSGLAARDGNGSPGFSPGAREQDGNRSHTGDQSRRDRQEGGSNADARPGDSGSASGGIYI
ncbi:MAG: flagellar hook-length control protein FliK [Nitratireductor sp.]